MKTKKKRNIIILIILALIIAIGSTVGIVLGVVLNKKGHGGNTGGDDSDDNGGDTTPVYTQLEFDKKSHYKVQQSMNTLGTINRRIPSISNEGLCTRYPVYGTELKDLTDEERTNLYTESALLLAKNNDSNSENGTYNSMDKDGNLYLDGVATGKRLYKHTASTNMYFGEVSDTEKAVIEKITINAKEDRNYITGLYAPAGEVIKIEISQEDLDKVGGLSILIGSASPRNFYTTIKTNREIKRMPTIVNRMEVNDVTTYVGNYLGGPIYIYPKKTNVEFNVVISGAVKYPVYIQGYTTREQLKEMEKLSAPYYDFELWDVGVRHSGAKIYGNFDFDNLYRVGEYWEKVVRTSQRVPPGSSAKIGIGFIYDVYVSAGAACAWVGRNWVEGPSAALAPALDYNGITTAGIWGTMHELNHHYQNYGAGQDGEVTNNATTLLSYCSYTNISANRGENDNALGTDWKRYTDASRSLRETISNMAVNKDADKVQPQYTLNIYADIIHSFGVDTYIKATRYNAGKHGVDYWYEALCEATGYDMTYYFETMLNHTVSATLKEKYNNGTRPIYVPIASIYQTGRSYISNGKEYYTNTMRPYRLYKSHEYTLDLNSKIIVPTGFTFNIKEVTSPQNGTLTPLSDNKYKLITTNDTYSGEIKVKIELTDGTITTPDVTLIFNFEYIDELPTVTKYTYSNRIYETPQDAISSNFAGYEKVETVDYNGQNFNRTANKQIIVINSKIYIPQDGTYIFCLRAGRGNHSLYVSQNGTYYKDVINYSGAKNTFTTNDDQCVTYTLKKGDYIWLKQITVADRNASDAYTEMGWAVNGASCVKIPMQYTLGVNATYGTTPYESEALYPTSYDNYQKTIYNNDYSQFSLVDITHGYWDDTTKPENMLDGNQDTFYHSNQNNFVSADNPCDITLNLGDVKKYNQLIITNRKVGTVHMPITFKLYGGTTLDNMVLIKEYTNVSYSGLTLSVDFDTTLLQYVKISITDTNTHRYVSIADIQFNYKIVGTEIPCDDITYYNFHINTTLTGTFGHIISGNGYLTYSYTGHGLLLNTRQDSACTIKVDIDGVEKEYHLAKTNTKEFIYLPTITYGQHNLKITIVSGTLDVDSLIIIK